MKRRLVIAGVGLVALLFVWSALQLAPPRLRAGREWPVLADVTIVNPGSERRAHQTLTMRGGVIESIRDVVPGAVLRPAARLYAGRYVLPGLIDMDVRALPSAAHLLRLDGVRFLAGGITTVRVVGNVPGDITALQSEIAAGDFPWPRLVACGPALVGAGSACTTARRVLSPDAAPAAVDAANAAGAGCVAVDRSLDPSVLAAVAVAAAARGVPVVGDLSAGVPPTGAEAMDLRLLALATPPAGALRIADWLQGWSAMTAADVDTLAALLGGRGASVTSSLRRWSGLDCAAAAQADPARGVFQPRFMREVEWPARRDAACAATSAGTQLDSAQRTAAVVRMVETLAALRRAGVAIHPGSGTPTAVDPGYGLWLELAALTHAGFTPEEVWRAATRDAGAALGIPGLGTVVAGAPADLLVFRDDPTRDLRGLETLEAVISQGRAYPAYKLTRYSLEWARYVQHKPYEIAALALARLRHWWSGDDAFACEPL